MRKIKKINRIRSEYFFFILLGIIYLVFRGFYVNSNVRYLLFFYVAFYYLYIFSKNYKSSIKNFKKFYYLFIIYYLILFLKGIILGNYFSYILADAFNFSGFFILFMISKFDTPKKFYFFILPEIGFWLNIFSIFFAIIYILKFGVAVSSFTEGRELVIYGSPIGSPKYLMYISFYLFPLYYYVSSRFKRGIYILSISMFILFSFFMASRGTSVIGLFVLFSTLFITYRGFNYKYMLLGFIILIIMSSIPSINQAVKYTDYRIKNDKYGYYRILESELLLEKMNTSEILFGKGFGAANKVWIFSKDKHGVNSVHFGWAYLILKGGVVLLLLIYGTALLYFFKLFSIKSLKPYSLIILSFLFSDYSHNNYIYLFRVFLLFLALNSIIIIKNEKSITY